MDEGELRERARLLVESGEVLPIELWILYRGQGGDAGYMELEAFLYGKPLQREVEVELLNLAVELFLSGHYGR